MKAGVGLLLLLALAVGEAVACTCIPPSTETAREQADAIFLGKITSLRILEPNNPGSRVIVDFQVSAVWKGIVPEHFQMESIIETSFCEGFFRSDLVLGKELLVFANRARSGLRYIYTTNICTLTGLAERRQDTIKELGHGKAPKGH
jgi:hypothetical protein